MVSVFSVTILEGLINPFFMFISVLIGAFLFWRASRYDLVDSQNIFDVVLIFIAAALIGGRLGDFLIRYTFYKWSPLRLFFFNAFGGFDYYFAALGGFFAVWIYMKNRRENFWFVVDLLAAPFIFALSFYLLTLYIYTSFVDHSPSAHFSKLLFFLFYFIVFWLLKRLGRRKRHKGL